MNLHLKKLLSVSLSAIISMSCLAAVLTVQADDLIAINPENFPDAVWRSAVSDYADKNSDGYLSVSERSLTTLPISGWIDEGQQISNLKGVEYFTSVKRLRIGDLGLESIDISALTQLQTLTAQGNKFTSLDVSGNTALTDLDCRGNGNLTSLVLNSSLTKLQCDECNLSQLDVSMCPKLEFLTCYANNLTSLNLSNNPLLSNLICSYNNLAYLDLSANPALSGSVTAYHIGNQSISSTASFSGENLYVPVSVENAENISSSNIKNPNQETEPDPDDSEPEDVYTGYDAATSSFAFTEYDLILHGIDYTYNVGLENAEDMTVHVNVMKDFFRVRYLSQQEGGTVVKTQYVNNGGNSVAPPMPQPPEGKTCGVWNMQGNDISQDTDIYVIWNSQHPYELIGFDQKTKTAVVYCSVCYNTYRTAFVDHANCVRGGEGYEKVLDVNDDGTINARDYAILINMF